MVPEDIKKALNKRKTVAKNFNSFNDSHKKQTLYWIGTANKRNTRLKRIKVTVEAAAENKKPFY
ncbi:YdeI/OmpD-associated family protein [Methanobacterium petrolearium]|uniref:YdeI/OmpD-associated family protein n=1 Tax=Methanobacterium petrolearium TaxID=710190 RepID=UPI001AE4591A|nr:YdeI/OmpD-associated family protein [Methanobacterium petrolearium]MBP1944786.1 uncharacterized protein YdeI (YjbR/CyaY-like superfamily) [Methanobacterium petrolearium]